MTPQPAPEPAVRTTADIPEAGRGRRVAATAIDFLALLTSPAVLLIMAAPFVFPFVEILVFLVPALVLSYIAERVLSRLRRLPNGDKLSPGQLALGLSVLRTETGQRVVLATDVSEAARPSRRRVIAGRIALVPAALIAAVMLAPLGLYAYSIVFQTADGAALEARALAEEPQARAASSAFLHAVLSGPPGDADGLVAGEAARQLPPYRASVRMRAVPGFSEQGSGWSSDGIYNYDYIESTTATAAVSERTLSLQVERRGERFVITQIAETGAVE
jgi:hypothetical protein